MNDSRKLTLIVPDEVVVTEGPESKPEDFEEHARIPKLLTRRGYRSKEIDLDKLQNGLQGVQGHIDELLKGVKGSTVAGYRLNSIEVSLGISAEGSIGIASAGVQASISLSFERVA